MKHSVISYLISLTVIFGMQSSLSFGSTSDEGGDSNQGSDGIQIVTHTESSLVSQDTQAGSYWTLIYVGSPMDPERYEFEVLGAQSLSLQEDGSLVALDEEGKTVAKLVAPSATDAQGTDVPTHFEVKGTHFTQIVEHLHQDYKYGIVGNRGDLLGDIGDDIGNVWKTIKGAANRVWKTVGGPVKCGLDLTAAFVPEGRIFKAIREIGGVEKVLKLMSKAKDVAEFLKDGGKAAEDIVGIADIRKDCF